jgi:putative membrane protein
LLFESVGVLTGRIYGPYHYTAHLGPRFLGLVPYAIPMAWFMMMYPAYVIADNLLPARMPEWKRKLSLAALGGVVMTAWDIVMDPVMVAGGSWVWEVDGAYFGVPLQNYWGWWLTTFAALSLFIWAGKITPGGRAGLPPGFDRLAVISYSVTSLGNVLVALMAGLEGPALAGFFAVLITRFFYPEAGVFFIAGLGVMMISLAYLSEYFRSRRKKAKGAESR